MIPVVIALVGPAGAGKTTVANYLVERYGAKRYSFAKPLKEIAKRVFDFTDEQLYGTQEQKEADDPRYNFSARWLLQRLGTEGCRAVLGIDIWTKTCLNDIVSDGHPLAVIDDMRFETEEEAIHYHPHLNGQVWRLFPVGYTQNGVSETHASEREWCTCRADQEIRPSVRSVELLQSIVDNLMGRRAVAL